VTVSRTFTVNVEVPKPQTQQNIHATSVSFRVASDRVEEGQEAALVGWFMGLPAEAREAVRTGQTQIHLTGHASTTQPGSANRVLSRGRAQRVQEILRDIAGSNAKFEIFALGEYVAGTPDDVEDADERRVDVSFSYVGPAPGSTTPTPAPAPGTP
jgi:outer membrane protein OmpA-like peptidoglycan-associated protein